MRKLITIFAFGAMLIGPFLHVRAMELWETELAKMPLATNRIHFFKSEPARAILPAFLPNVAIKAILFLPGSTDELYFNDRGVSYLTNAKPNLLEALSELTNHTSIRAVFRSPFLLLGETNDFFAPILTLKENVEEKLRAKISSETWLMMDKEWDFFYPALIKSTGLKITPRLGSPDAWHFYRVYFASRDLNALEAVKLISLATRTEVRSARDALMFSRRSTAP